MGRITETHYAVVSVTVVTVYVAVVRWHSVTLARNIQAGTLA